MGRMITRRGALAALGTLAAGSWLDPENQSGEGESRFLLDTVGV
jgi:hypothetical protein